MEFTSIILAAGMGTRMKSKQPKVLHKVCGKELAAWVIDAAKKAGANKVCTVIGHCADEVKNAFGDRCEYALQKEQKGRSCSFTGNGFYRQRLRGCVKR